MYYKIFILEISNNSFYCHFYIIALLDCWNWYLLINLVFLVLKYENNWEILDIKMLFLYYININVKIKLEFNFEIIFI